jgi:uncharacterized protein YjiS (DUF1127 family)
MSLRRWLDRLAAIDAALRRRAALERLDERALRDVGLTRAQIDAEIRRLRPGRGLLARRRTPMPAEAEVSDETKSSRSEIVT